MPALVGSLYRDEDNPFGIKPAPPTQPAKPSPRPEGWIGLPNPGLPNIPQQPDWAQPGYNPTVRDLPGGGVLPGGGGILDRISAAPGTPTPFVKPTPPVAPTAPTPRNPNLDAHPGVIAAHNAENLGLAELENMLKKAREQMIIRFGDPALASMAGFGLDPQAGTFARQNYLSGNADLARIDKAQERRRKAIIDRLAGRGILFSGDLGYQEGEAAAQYGNEVYDARQQVLAKLNDLMESYLSQKRALRGNTANALGGAFQDFISNPDLYAGIYGNA